MSFASPFWHCHSRSVLNRSKWWRRKTKAKDFLRTLQQSCFTLEWYWPKLLDGQGQIQEQEDSLMEYLEVIWQMANINWQSCPIEEVCLSQLLVKDKLSRGSNYYFIVIKSHNKEQNWTNIILKLKLTIDIEIILHIKL